MSMHRFLVFLALFAASGAALALSPGVVNTQLSDIQQASGDASKLIVSDNGATVCFVADRDTDEARELFCGASNSPQTATRISSGLLPTGTGATNVVLSSDGAFVYYLAPEISGSKVELFRAPTNGSGPRTQINAALLPAGGDVKKYQLLESQQLVLYSADAESAGVVELYVVDLATPGSSSKLSGPVVSGGNGVKQFRFDESTSRVYYTSEQQTLNKIELYGNALAGGALIPLSGPIASGDFVGSVGFVPGGAYVYYSEVTAAGAINLWAASSTMSGTAWKVNQPIPDTAQASVVAISPAGDRLVYVADVSVDGRFGLYSRALDGSDPQPLQIDDAIVEFAPMTLNPLPRIRYLDGSTLLYVDAYNVDGIGKLVVDDDEGVGSPTVLTGSLDVREYSVAGSRGEAVITHDVAGNVNLSRVALDGSGITPLTTLASNGGVSRLSGLDPEGRYWAFQADPNVADRQELFRIDLDVPGVTTLSSAGDDFEGVIRAVARPAVGGGWVCFDEYRFSSMLLIKRWILRCTGRAGVSVRDMAQMSMSLISGSERQYTELLPAPDTPDRVFYIGDTPSDDVYEAYQADYEPTLFVDGFEN